MDSEDVDGFENYNVKKSDDLYSMITDLFGGIRYKFYFLMFISFLLLSSDVFINRILGTINGATDNKVTTSWGTCIQGFMLVLTCIIFDLFINQKII